MADTNWEAVKPNNVSFNKVDDYIAGTLVEKVKPNGPDQFGNEKMKYVIRADEGKFFAGAKDENGNYQIDNMPTEPEDGSMWNFYGKPAVDAQMRSIKENQKVKLKLTEIRKTKKGHPAKIIQVFAGPMAAPEEVEYDSVDADSVDF